MLEKFTGAKTASMNVSITKNSDSAGAITDIAGNMDNLNSEADNNLSVTENIQSDMNKFIV